MNTSVPARRVIWEPRVFAGILLWLLFAFVAAIMAQLGGSGISILSALGGPAVFALVFGVAFAFVPLLRLPNHQRLVVVVIAFALLALAPMLLPAQPAFVRVLTACAVVAMWAKIYDLHVGAKYGLRPAASSALEFMPRLTALVFRKINDATLRPTRRQLLRAAGRFTIASAGIAAIFLFDWRGLPFVAEHTVKVIAVFYALLLMAEFIVAADRALGGPSLDFSRAPMRARTPAEFWRRYNRPVMQFFNENVFKRVGGRHAPARATLIVFAISGLAHEYAFDVGAGHVQGLQLLFFMLQGVAVAATMHLRPSGAYAVIGVIATFIFNLTTSVIFFASADAIVPFYANPLPEWLS